MKGRDSVEEIVLKSEQLKKDIYAMLKKDDSEELYKYEFKEIGKINRTIKEREYSHKSFDRARANSIILYQIENNVNNIRDFILDAYRNKKTFDNYIEEYSKIDDIISDSNLERIKFSRKKYNKIEKRIIKEILYDKKIYNISMDHILIYCWSIFYKLKFFDTLLTKHFVTIYNICIGGVLWITLTKNYEQTIFIINEVSPAPIVPISTRPFRHRCISTKTFMSSHW